ncbi:uncharacterized protein [Haliotis cracherodii]|uniref:uncharacterized protein n=1 Tax=Haliotis cracherodii TaxID=6455 RepID=UPI0039EC2055
MSSILSCFCVQRRRTFVTRKRNSRKKILTRKSDWSDVSSDLYTPHSSDSIPRGQDEDGQILARLLENQHSPRRRHVSDIFRHEPPATTTTPIPNRSVFNGGAEDNMCGYVPKAVGEMSASTALTGAKFDDFFSDCRLYPALGKFAKSTDLSDQSASYYTLDRSEDKSSLVTLGTANVYTTTPTHVQIEIGRVETQFDDVIRGSMSSASPSPVPSQADNLENPQQSDVLEIGTPTRNMGSYAKDLENMFACDGDILY